MDIDFADLERRVYEDEAKQIEAHQKGEAEAPVVYRTITDAVRAPRKTGDLEFVASEESDDRAGDIIRAAGWKLTNFKRNPVMLWAHDHRTPPIGRWPDVKVVGKQLLATATFDAGDPLAASIEAKYRGGFMRAVSVGFKALEAKPRVKDDEQPSFFGPMEFIKQELVEISAVPVGMHPKALRKGLELLEGARTYIFMPGNDPGQFVAKVIEPDDEPDPDEHVDTSALLQQAIDAVDALNTRVTDLTVRMTEVEMDATSEPDPNDDDEPERLDYDRILAGVKSISEGDTDASD